MDFFKIVMRDTKNGGKEVFPDFVVGRSKDLMIRGNSFYAVWDEEAGLWSTDEYDVQRLVDKELSDYVETLPFDNITVKYLRSFNSTSWGQFRRFVQNLSDNSHPLDEKLVFANTAVKKTDYASKRLPYPLETGDCSAWDELVGTLYSVEERRKIEWAIGAVVSGDSRKIQKFLVFYGPPGSGKGTMLDIILRLFEGYTTTFDAKSLGNSNAMFATEAFRHHPLVAVQHDGDLSKIEDNTRLNAIVSHESMTLNEKFKASYTSKINAMLFMGTNNPVKISDAKSGIIRRLIDVIPTGVRIPANHYSTLVSRVEFELGAIAHQCLQVYLEHGKHYYNGYRPLEMMFQTDIFFNFIEAYYDIFKAQDGVSLRQAYQMYKEYCNEAGIDKPLPQYKVREELRNYFDEFKDKATVGDEVIRSYYAGFNANKFKMPGKDVASFSLVMDEKISLLDELWAEMPAQYGSEAGTPKTSWARVRTTLKDLDTTEVHYVKVPEKHIVIDFDLRDESGGKSLERNLGAASAWPPTYGELSKSGAGVHLHYVWTGPGDPSELDPNYSDGIEVKSFPGNGALRRRVTRCNAITIAELNTGLAVKEKSVIPMSTMQSEKGLRELIHRNLRKEIHPGTKPSVDFIKKILDDAYRSGMSYDVTDMRSRIIGFANNSSNRALECLGIVQQMKFVGGPVEDNEPLVPKIDHKLSDDRLAFYDVEIFPNLFIICWKFQGSDTIVRMVNPTAQDIEPLFKLKLVGFNNRRFDNHLLYARFMGYTVSELYTLAQRLINNEQVMFGEAYSLSYADIYDFSSKKQSLKKFEIELGVHHLELDLPWDVPVPETMWEKVVDYCCNDVIATEVTFEARKQDFVARQILAELSGLTVNDTTQKHTARIIFGQEKNPQRHFVYTDLSKMFPGYTYDMGKSYYRGEEIGEGGYVYAEPDMYTSVDLLDVASMHPTSIRLLNLFGNYTPNFTALLEARLAIKHGDYDLAVAKLGAKVEPFLQNREDAEALSYALKIVINIVYGLTSAKFTNPFRDPRNKDNIAAKRGALFMIDLKYYVQELGYTVAHIKTDSIKIPNADKYIIDMVTKFGAKYGYIFEHEATYDKFALVNDAVYVAHSEKKGWSATGAQFAHPYVFKQLFTVEEIELEDLFETRQVSKGSMYLDFESVQSPMFRDRGMQFVGRTGRFVPVTEESGGGLLLRVDGDKKYAVSGTKGYFWIEAEHLLSSPENFTIDIRYFEKLEQEALKTLAKFGDVDSFLKG